MECEAIKLDGDQIDEMRNAMNRGGNGAQQKRYAESA